MIRELRVQPLAEADLSQAYRWYELQRNGLGRELLQDAESCFERIARNPASFPYVRGSVRRALLKRFPYCAYFDDTRTTIMVLAVLHGRRHPAVWKSRI